MWLYQNSISNTKSPATNLLKSESTNGPKKRSLNDEIVLEKQWQN